jgi:phosphopantothenoylcysteine decarboxylase/phosphopantothenate--cysteine ligase
MIAEARRKLETKRLDLIVANDVTAAGAGFERDTNVVHLLDAAGLDEALPLLPKTAVAARILDWVVARRRAAKSRRLRPARPTGS